MRVIRNRPSRGVALVLVLMVVGTLSVLMLQIGLTSRAQVRQSQAITDRIEAELHLQSREASLVFSLLTHPWNLAPPSTVGALPQRWSFAGESFVIDDVQFEIQDLAGLRPFPQDVDAALGLAPLMQNLLGMSVEEASAATLRLTTAMREPDWVLVQSFADLVTLGVLRPDQADRLRRSMTLFPSAAFNPLTAPDEVLGSKFQGATLSALLALRDRGELDAFSFAKVTGVDDEFNSFAPGSALRIRSRFEKSDIVASSEGIWLIKPYDSEPVRVWSRHSEASAGR